jgi:hypothetical protein
VADEFFGQETVTEPVQLFSNRSVSIAQLAKALASAQGEMEHASKDSTNPHFKSKYADLASIREACKPLSKVGIAILQPVRATGTAVTVTTMLVHSSGEWIAEDLTMTAGQNTPQAIGSAITYGRRYGLAAMVGIAPEDDDGQAASKPAERETKAADPVPTMPANFGQTWATLLKQADHGLPAMQAAWRQLSKETQAYIQANHRPQWEKAKEAARENKPEAVTA